MKRIACLLLAAALAGNGCLGVQNVPPEPATPAPVAPPPPPVLPGQTTEANAAQVLQALSDEIDRAAAEPPVTPSVSVSISSRPESTKVDLQVAEPR